ncbi:hypothetical protein [Pseudonocardia sp. H11422]|uniref:hypothetical protein n=1 Tax=Pseudonocardia sp. H11422 TaxID=2835866 RepID=UPI001BDDB667|nr:hypothetical protein [Pseudonocardia sp. H11422]
MSATSTLDRRARLDWSEVARGASSALSVLVIGGLVQPLVAALVPPLGVVWLIVVAVAAFAAAGRHVAASSAPVLQGATAAVLGYLFILPVVVLVNRGVEPAQLGGTVVTAVLVGGLTAHIRTHFGAPRDGVSAGKPQRGEAR